MTAFSANTKENVLPWFMSVLSTTLSKLIIDKEKGGGFIFIPRLEQKQKAEGMTYYFKIPQQNEISQMLTQLNSLTTAMFFLVL